MIDKNRNVKYYIPLIKDENVNYYISLIFLTSKKHSKTLEKLIVKNLILI